ncbi:MAG: hypothetical protein PUK59_07140 [Actinomycetaceae bacterium]|nr:hypothetical protein [Actinomycetaceae bacterium]MDY5854938.1 hypothetical protein [Arcanobacterium sp.]
MSITDDRQELYTALNTLAPIGDTRIRLCLYAPQKAQPYTAYIELAGAEQAPTFGHLQVVWEITATASARLAASAAAEFLDQLTGAIIRAIHGQQAADLANVEPYFVLSDPSNGAAIPATRLTFTSRTTI